MSHYIQKRFTGASITPKLSPNFAVKLIDKEAELERNCNVDIIQELVQLYTEAVEYYAFIKDNKSYDYQERMHKMFVRPDVIKAIKQNIPSSPVKNMTMQQRKVESQKAKTSQVAVDLFHNREVKSLNRIIDYQKLRNIEVARKAAMEFKLQDQDLQKRLDSRKKSMLTKSMDGSRYVNKSILQDKTLKAVSEESDSQTTSFVKFMEEDEIDIEYELENIMEKYCNEKASKLSQIQVKYETQLKEMDGPGPLMEQIRAQLRVDMKNELDTAEKEIDSKKEKEIHGLKAGHTKNSISLF